jgi:hypothetical protein
MFVIAYGFVTCLLDCANSLLDISGISCELDSIYVDENDNFKVIFKGHGVNSGSAATMLCGLVKSLGERGSAQGLVNYRVCAQQLIRRIETSGASLKGMQKQIELVHREWDCILM